MDIILNFFNSLGQDYVNGLMLTGLICVNILLGSIDALIGKEWNTTKFVRG